MILYFQTTLVHNTKRSNLDPESIGVKSFHQSKATGPIYEWKCVAINVTHMFMRQQTSLQNIIQPYKSLTCNLKIILSLRNISLNSFICRRVMNNFNGFVCQCLADPKSRMCLWLRMISDYRIFLTTNAWHHRYLIINVTSNWFLLENINVKFADLTFL